MVRLKVGQSSSFKWEGCLAGAYSTGISLYTFSISMPWRLR